MAPRLSGQNSIFGVVFFVSKSLLGIEGQKKLEKFAILTRKPRSHARISIYRTWPIQLLYLRREICMNLEKMCMMCMVLSPNCCAVTVFEYSTTEVTLPSCLSVPSEHVASQSKWQSADLDLVKLAKKRKSV